MAGVALAVVWAHSKGYVFAKSAPKVPPAFRVTPKAALVGAARAGLRPDVAAVILRGSSGE